MSGDSRADRIVVYAGLPEGMELLVLLLEHSYSNPEDYRAKMSEAVNKGGAALAAALGAIPVVGPFLALAAEAAWAKYGPEVSKISV